MLAAIDTVWDMIDLYNDARDCLGDSDSMACYMAAAGVAFIAMGALEGPSNNVARRAAKAADVGDAAGDVGRRFYGPYYDEAVELAKKDPGFFPDPDDPVTQIVKGDELEIRRRQYDRAAEQGLIEKGHHRLGIASGGDPIDTNNIVFTGESTIRRSELHGLDISFYSKYGKPNAEVLKIHQLESGGIYVFGLNPRHTAATNFQNKVLRWQRSMGLR